MRVSAGAARDASAESQRASASAVSRACKRDVPARQPRAERASTSAESRTCLRVGREHVVRRDKHFLALLEGCIVELTDPASLCMRRAGRQSEVGPSAQVGRLPWSLAFEGAARARGCRLTDSSSSTSAFFQSGCCRLHDEGRVGDTSPSEAVYQTHNGVRRSGTQSGKDLGRGAARSPGKSTELPSMDRAGGSELRHCCNGCNGYGRDFEFGECLWAPCSLVERHGRRFREPILSGPPSVGTPTDAEIEYVYDDY